MRGFFKQEQAQQRRKIRDLEFKREGFSKAWQHENEILQAIAKKVSELDKRIEKLKKELSDV